MATNLSLRSSRRVVLVVDDDQDIRLTLASVLELAGFIPLTAESSTEAKRYLAALKLHAVITELRLNGEDASWICADFKHRGAAKSLFIAHTAWVTAETKLQARAVGFDAFIAKPADPEDLVRLLVRNKGKRPANPFLNVRA